MAKKKMRILPYFSICQVILPEGVKKENYSRDMSIHYPFPLRETIMKPGPKIEVYSREEEADYRKISFTSLKGILSNGFFMYVGRLRDENHPKNTVYILSSQCHIIAAHRECIKFVKPLTSYNTFTSYFLEDSYLFVARKLTGCLKARIKYSHLCMDKLPAGMPKVLGARVFLDDRRLVKALSKSKGKLCRKDKQNELAFDWTHKFISAVEIEKQKKMFAFCHKVINSFYRQATSLETTKGHHSYIGNLL